MRLLPRFSARGKPQFPPKGRTSSVSPARRATNRQFLQHIRGAHRLGGASPSLAAPLALTSAAILPTTAPNLVRDVQSNLFVSRDDRPTSGGALRSRARFALAMPLPEREGEGEDPCSRAFPISSPAFSTSSRGAALFPRPMSPKRCAKCA